MTSKQKVVNNTADTQCNGDSKVIKKTMEIGTQTDLIERDYIPIKQLALMQTESVAFP